MALSGMRGLSVFVSDIRNCQNKEQVRLRVDKELGNIRKRFKTEKVSVEYTVRKCKLCAAFDRIDLYVDVILQLIDKAGEFISDDIWFCVVQFVTNNEDLQPYTAAKAREYLDKPAIHETMVSEYILGEFGHLLVRQPGCSPKVIFNIIHEKLPTVSSKVCHNAIEKGASLMDILAEMPKFPKRQSAMIKKAEDTDVDATEQSAINGTPPVSQLSLVCN
ncbi:hypothetical protein GYH30_031165 [Glycine max]|uniref:Clathrin/coatomer adaptor adaptin-like N-terminal domain-containing protein n=2 Tax=Glycine subgen. Soja TaxID=1462606 RepID=K7LQ88_SOYBN|nr:hypothetical protein GYH30_031165 [Glycine max]KHN38678.1 AP-2 complex subunit alpha-1 [Glycine soja]RZB80351.1 AP-2 complex subunit alpha-1 [Glycine soja]